MPTEKKITYLLGAGASYNALPIVNEIPNKLREMASFIITRNEEQRLGELSLTKLWDEIATIEEHASIDTLARKYWLLHKNDFANKDYLRIKQIITCLLIYCQVTKPKLSNHERIDNYNNRKTYLIDPRYESFFSALLTNKFELPNNISILTWNYDFQIEKSFDFYFQSQSIKDTGERMGFDYMKAKTDSNVNMIKLNGTAFFVNGIDPSYLCYKVYDIRLHKLFCSILGNDYNLDYYPGIKFSWETFEDTLATENRARAAAKIKESDIIIVIGYSFPIFNREVDIQIFKDFTGDKIYIQDTPERVEQIKNQLESIKDGLSKKCETQTNLDQFLIPNEYWTAPVENISYVIEY